MGLKLRDRKYHTYGEYLGWPEDVRYELVEGVAYLMAPAPDLAHQDVAGEIFFQARRALEGKSCRVFIAPVDVRLPNSDEADDAVDTVVQPDVLVVCDETKLDRRAVHPIGSWRSSRLVRPRMTTSSSAASTSATA